MEEEQFDDEQMDLDCFLDLGTRDIELMEECIDSASVVQDVADTPSYTVGQCMHMVYAQEQLKKNSDFYRSCIK